MTSSTGIGTTTPAIASWASSAGIKQAQAILNKIDQVTAKDPAHPGKDNLTDHRGRVVLDDGTFLHDNEDYANFIIDKNGDVINIDPLNMDSVMKRGPPKSETARQKVVDAVDRAIGAVEKMISGEKVKPIESPAKTRSAERLEPDRGRAPPAEEIRCSRTAEGRQGRRSFWDRKAAARLSRRCI